MQVLQPGCRLGHRPAPLLIYCPACTHLIHPEMVGRKWWRWWRDRHRDEVYISHARLQKELS